MRTSILTIILAAFISSSCQQESNKSEIKDQNVKAQIQLNGIEGHPNKEQMEWLLNNYEEEFVSYEEDWKTLEHENLIQKGYAFHMKKSKVSVIIIFCKNQQDALTIVEANFSNVDGPQFAGVNGGVLFVVQGDDQYKVDKVLGWFGGEE